MCDNWQEIVRCNCVHLQEQIETEYGLRGELLKRKVFIPRIINNIWDIKDIGRRKAELLDQLSRGSQNQFKLFCESLEACGQQDIVSELLTRVIPKPKDRTDATPVSPKCFKPLQEWQRDAINSHFNDLVDNINSDEGLLSHFESDDLFTALQRQQLRNAERTSDRNELLLDLLRRGSEEQYDGVCLALVANSQDHIVASYLKGTTQSSAFPFSSRVSCETQQKQAVTPHHTTGQLPPVPRTPTTSPVSCTEVSVSLPTQVTESGMTDEHFSPQPPAANLVSIMQQQITEKKAYDITYGPNRSAKRGRALIIANEKFRTLEHRSGTDEDIWKLENCFNYLAFDVVKHIDLTATQIRNICRAESRRESHRTSTVNVVCILSHGNKGTVYGIDGQEVTLEEIMTFFDGTHCQALRNRPKLFFVQACQGHQRTEGVDASDSGVFSLGTGDAVDSGRKHEKADMAIVLSAYPGYAAWRNQICGSYFIDFLTKVLQQHAHEQHFDDMIKEVVRRMNEQVMSDRYKQVCQLRSTLDKHVYLLPY